MHLYFLIEHPGFFALFDARDAEKYHEMAWQLINEGIYGYNSDTSNAYVTPGHPLYLTAIFLIAKFFHMNEIELVKVINMFLSLSIILLIYLASKKIFKNEVVALISALLFSTYLSPLHFFRSLLTELPATFMFTLSIFVYALSFENKKVWHHILFGFVASITLMFRPTPAPLLLLAWLFILIKHRWKTAINIGLLWCIGPIFIILPWVIRNYIQFGKPYIFSSHSGNPLLAGTNPFYLDDFETYLKKAEELGLTQEEYAILRIKEGFKENFNLWFSWFTLGKTIYMFKEPASLLNYWGVFPTLIKGFYILQHFYVVIVGFLCGIIFRKNKEVLGVFLILLGYVGISNVFLPLPRYGFYIIPVLCILSGYATYKFIIFIIDFFKKRAIL